MALQMLQGFDTLPTAYTKINNNFSQIVLTPNGFTIKLEALGDVEITLPLSVGQSLSFNGTKWTNVSIPSNDDLTLMVLMDVL